MIPFMKVGSANILENYLYIGLVLIALCTSGLTHVMDKSNKLEFIYVFHHHENALSKLSLLDKTMQS